MRNYTMTLRTEAPVFVGDGGKIGKKEYIFMSGERRVYVPDMVKMYRYFEERRLMDDAPAVPAVDSLFRGQRGRGI